MLTTALSLTYLGAALCYAASPKSASAVDAALPPPFSPRVLRLTGAALLGTGLALSIVRGPVGAGLLLWLSMAMAAWSLLVIAAPLVDRFVPATGALAFAIALVAPWV